MWCYVEGPEGMKWELEIAYFFARKVGIHALGLGSIGEKTRETGNGIMICAIQSLGL